jgi:GDP-4-dehydro-6-deoxy-D-mannose reductase
VERADLDCRVVVTGSALVYRPSPDALTEDSDICPTNPYGLSKLAQEMAATRASQQGIVARAFNHAGPGQSDAYVTSSFARQIAEAEAGLREPVLRVGNLESRRDITDVRDTIRAYVLLQERGRPGRSYNVCSGRAYQVSDLLDMLVGMSRTPLRIETDPDRMRKSDNPIVLGDGTRIREEVGWFPRIPIAETLSDLLAFWRMQVAAPDM